MRRMTYDITKQVPKKHFLQKYDFLFVWNANLIIYKENFFFHHYFSRNPCLHSSEKLNIKHLRIESS